MSNTDELTPTGSGIEVSAEATATAAALATLVREVTRNLPFGAEPADFQKALERLAREEGED